MSDLISRSKVIDVLKETGIIQDNDLGHLVVDEICRISTAYDIDNVVAELKNKSFKAMNYPDNVVDLNEAIEMVKCGGVDDIQKCDSVDCSCMYIDRSRV